jgi:hypothetical protein
VTIVTVVFAGYGYSLGRKLTSHVQPQKLIFSRLNCTAAQMREISGAAAAGRPDVAKTDTGKGRGSQVTGRTGLGRYQSRNGEPAAASDAACAVSVRRRILRPIKQASRAKLEGPRNRKQAVRPLVFALEVAEQADQMRALNAWRQTFPGADPLGYEELLPSLTAPFSTRQGRLVNWIGS